VTKSMFQIFALLTRLRQACNHMALTSLAQLELPKREEFETLSFVTAQEWTDEDADANLIETESEMVVVEEEIDSPFAFGNGHSAKLQAIMDELGKVWSERPNAKVLIFSQYVGFITILQQSLESRDIPFYRLVGDMNQKERTKALDKFSETKGRQVTLSDEKMVQCGCVLLISTKVGAVGLNLTCASCVFICDLWWHAAMDDQCINRVHRIGQKANVVLVRKFIVADSVEEKILSLQKRKKALSSLILGDNVSQLKGDGANSYPTIEDYNILFAR